MASAGLYKALHKERMIKKRILFFHTCARFHGRLARCLSRLATHSGKLLPRRSSSGLAHRLKKAEFRNTHARYFVLVAEGDFPVEHLWRSQFHRKLLPVSLRGLEHVCGCHSPRHAEGTKPNCSEPFTSRDSVVCCLLARSRNIQIWTKKTVANSAEIGEDDSPLIGEPNETPTPRTRRNLQGFSKSSKPLTSPLTLVRHDGCLTYSFLHCWDLSTQQRLLKSCYASPDLNQSPQGAENKPICGFWWDVLAPASLI
jgi:hypothetical protein